MADKSKPTPLADPLNIQTKSGSAESSACKSPGMDVKFGREYPDQDTKPAAVQIMKLAPRDEIDPEMKQFYCSVVASQPDFREYRKVVESIFDCNPLNGDKLNTGANPKFSNPGSPETEKFVAKNKIPLTSSNAFSLLQYVTEKYIHAHSNNYGDDDGTPVMNDWTTLPGVNTSYLQIIGEQFQYWRRHRFNNGDHVLAGNTGSFNDWRSLMPLELIWSYWMEEGMLVQSMNAISKRFQNIRNAHRDPLANLTIDPLRPLNNLLWGYIQTSQFRLTIARRNYEYEHEYGLRLIGKAVPDHQPADRRSKFLEAFNNLLYQCTIYYNEFNDLDRLPEPFPLLVSLQEVHLVMTEGSQNQFGDLPTTARVEMFAEQLILSNPVMQQFLGGRPMVAYRQPWMGIVDTMKTLQGWNPTSVTYFDDLATNGERILVSIRNRPWGSVTNANIAGNWAQVFRMEIQTYIHSYRIVTGVDLSFKSTTDARTKNTLPSLLIQSKLQQD
ncbi:hypothetical protein WBG78_04805 [Chryseolinea sp. T2]|uniref:hypothetical protein n=1 Tax=Chryseolinea sp. T2 TaxID=3129255 RepID=UPI0030783FA2